jgi:hypothetical protein
MAVFKGSAFILTGKIGPGIALGPDSRKHSQRHPQLPSLSTHFDLSPADFEVYSMHDKTNDCLWGGVS